MKRTQVQAVLAEEGLEHDAALTAALERIAALRLTEPPAPTGELARLLAAGPAEASTTAPLAVVLPLTRVAARKAEAAATAPRPRWIKRHRGAMIGVLVAAGMGLGASGVAAMTGQVWDWHAPLHPAVGPSLDHEAPAPAGTAPTGTPTGLPSLAQDEGAAGSGRTEAGQHGEQATARPVQGRDEGASPAARDARDQGAQDPGPQDQELQGSTRGRASGGSTGPARPSQAPRPSPSASGPAGSGQGGDGQGVDTQDAGR